MKKTIAIILGTLALSNSAFASKAELNISATVVYKCEFVNGRAICGNDLIRQTQQKLSLPMFVDLEENDDSNILFNESTITLEDNNSEMIIKSYEF